MEDSDLKKQLEECEIKLEKYLEGWKRERADFLNYKNEAQDQRIEAMRSTREVFLSDLFPVLDSLERAERSATENNNDPTVKGFMLVAKQLREFISKQGVQEMDPTGEQFDPKYHEAVQEVEGDERGVVVEVMEKGYMLEDKVLRPAKVKVTR